MTSPHSTTRSDLGDEIRRRRKARKLTQADLAKLAAIATTNVGKVERGDPVSPTTMRAVARALELPAELVAPYVEEAKTPAMPEAADFASEYEYILAVVSHLIRDRNMTADEVVVAVRMATAALRDRSNPDGKEVV